MASSIILLLTYILFWATYESWTNRNKTVQQADEAYEVDPYLISLRMNDILHSTPWQSKTIALIVFWMLAILSSAFINPVMIVDNKHKKKRAAFDKNIQLDHSGKMARDVSITSADADSIEMSTNPSPDLLRMCDWTSLYFIYFTYYVIFIIIFTKVGSD